MKNKLLKFFDILEDYGEFYLSSGSIKEDYNRIKSIIDFQGYFAGVSYRFYLDNNFDLIKVEERF